MTRAFGLSTHLYHGVRLERSHLLEIAAHEFSTLELRVTPSHFDYHNLAAVANLQQWLAEAGLELTSVHAPVCESVIAGQQTRAYSLASSDDATRQHAVAEVEAALHIARRIPFKTCVLHLGVPRAMASPTDNHRDAARRSLEALHPTAEALGVRLAIELLGNELSRPGSLIHFLEDVLELGNVGICLDTGHAQLDGDGVVDSIENVAEHLLAVDLNDNTGRRDDHLVPFAGAIDWPAALTTLEKVGYDGALMFELSGRGGVSETLQQARHAKRRMERLLAQAY